MLFRFRSFTVIFFFRITFKTARVENIFGTNVYSNLNHVNPIQTWVGRILPVTTLNLNNLLNICANAMKLENFVKYLTG